MPDPKFQNGPGTRPSPAPCAGVAQVGNLLFRHPVRHSLSGGELATGRAENGGGGSNGLRIAHPRSNRLPIGATAFAHALLCLWLFLTVRTVAAAPTFDTSTPASFFTNVADLVLRNETARWQTQDFVDFTNTFGTTTNAFGLANLPVYVNGVFVYSSSVQRLLQVTANIYEATSTNAYPAVFRPTFFRDPVSGNVFINGYQLVASVSGLSDSALASPVDISLLASGNLPATGSGSTLALNNINVYGVPWIIGARTGLPSFNELYLLNSVQVSRSLQVNRDATNAYIAYYTTNQMFVMSITNTVGVSLWNSYNSNYLGSGNLQVFIQDTMRMGLNNSVYSGSEISNFWFAANLSSWPGSAWTHAPISTTAPVPQSFIYTNFSAAFLPPSAYQYASGLFIPLTQNPAWETNVVNNYAFPQFSLMTTNWAQAFILDGSNVIDYVQLSGPNNTRNLTTELADPNYIGPPEFSYMWSTNGYGKINQPPWPTYGEVNQILVSKGIIAAPPGGTWASVPVFSGYDGTPAAQQAFFNGFWFPTYNYNGVTYANTEYTVKAPYTPTRTLYDYTLWQANDPLVHYLASDLNYIDPSTTGLQKSDTVPAQLNATGLNLPQLGKRFQPWGTSGQMTGLTSVDTNLYNLAYKDPLVWRPDYWNFPANQTWNPNWLGNVHRGTPWQSIYLKSTNILAAILPYGAVSRYVGTNTWEIWTGVANGTEAGRTSPVNDWHLAGLLATLLNTNASMPLFSVNNPDLNAWAAELDGLTAWTNSSPGETIVLSSNSPAVAALAAAIQTTRASQPSQMFSEVGNLLATPALSVHSPFLNPSGPGLITDADYEQLPDQLLALLGLNSVGAMATGNGGIRVQFSGGEGHVYAVQTSADLIHWTTLSTNTPVNNQFNLLLPAVPAGPAQFYRSVLLQ